jgi:hypothetical protein
MKPLIKGHRVPRPFGVLWVLLLGALAIPTSVESHAVGVSLSGFGTASIDGSLGPGEWATAGSVNFAVNLPQGGTAPATLFVMNDVSNLYLAIRIGATAARNSASLEFDNQHLGGSRFVTGDDGVIINPEIGFRDLVRVVDVPPCFFGAACSFLDTGWGGRATEPAHSQSRPA